MKTKEALTLLGVAAVAYIGTSMFIKSRNEKKSNVGGNPESAGTLDDSGEWCWDGSRWNPANSTTLCQGSISNRFGTLRSNSSLSRYSMASGAEDCGCGM